MGPPPATDVICGQAMKGTLLCSRVVSDSAAPRCRPRKFDRVPDEVTGRNRHHQCHHQANTRKPGWNAREGCSSRVPQRVFDVEQELFIDNPLMNRFFFKDTTCDLSI